MQANAGESGVDLYWLPLGAGGHSVRLNGQIFEALAARLQRRPPCDLYHSALVVRLPEGQFVIESAPVLRADGEERGVVAGGPVGARWAGRFRIFRYELRRWAGGVIPDIAEAVESPQRLTNDRELAQRVLDLVPSAPTPVWGRDELGAGEMWNSNSVISWLITRCGLDAESIRPPTGGRAPGWRSGVVVARRASAGAVTRHRRRHTANRVWLRWTIAWLGGSVLGIANGVARDTLYADRVGELTAEQISGATLVALLAGYFWMLERRWPIPTARQALGIGATWLLLTVAFEFLFGHFGDGKSWSELLENYDLSGGHLWVLVLVWVGVGPAVIRRLATR